MIAAMKPPVNCSPPFHTANASRGLASSSQWVATHATRAPTSPTPTRIMPTRSVSERGMLNRSLRREATMIPTTMPRATNRPKVLMLRGPMSMEGNA
ncbi:unannotated protein [freshwater metagenome]|uniref:Unannotated protein n=1 Tax=freshwater metagenome TaxID=449393 RepID=A0A6J7JXR3_9ZZZZ